MSSFSMLLDRILLARCISLVRVIAYNWEDFFCTSIIKWLLIVPLLQKQANNHEKTIRKSLSNHAEYFNISFNCLCSSTSLW